MGFGHRLGPGESSLSIPRSHCRPEHVINYRTDRFEGVVRKLTGKKGVDGA